MADDPRLRLHRFRWLGAAYELLWERDALRAGLEASCLPVAHRQAAERWVDRALDNPRGVNLLRGVLGQSGHFAPDRMSDAAVVDAVTTALELRRLRVRPGLDFRGGGAPGAGGPGGGAPPGPVPPGTPPAHKPHAPFRVTLRYVEFLAPGAEDPKPLVRWHITDPSLALANGDGKLELFRSFETPDKPIWTMPLEAAELQPGDHAIEWDGYIGRHDHFPQEHVSVEFSPYTLKITVTHEGHGAPRPGETAQVEFKVEVTAPSLELTFGDDDLLNAGNDPTQDERNKALIAEVRDTAAIPTHAQIRLPLSCNRFPTRGTRLDSLPIAAGFDELRTTWWQGPYIPLVASVYLRNSRGAPTLAPKGWGRRMVLWEFEYRDGNAASGPFVQDAANYLTGTSTPPGTACHLKRAGKRAEEMHLGAEHFRTPPVPGFPHRTATFRRAGRFFGANSTVGTYYGRSAVIFQPARQMGDGYVVSASFDPRAELDTVPPASAGFGARQARSLRGVVSTSRALRRKQSMLRNSHGTP